MPTEQTIHVHNGIRYQVNTEGRCAWYNCTHNVYNSFDDPEQVIIVDRDRIDKLPDDEPGTGLPE